MPTSTLSGSNADPFERAHIAARELARRTGVGRHDVLVVLGTGLSPVAEALGADTPGIDLANLPWFTRFTGHGHRAMAWSLAIGEQRVLVTAGRLHLYDGFGPIEVAHTVRTAAASGCRTAILTCAAGAIRPDLVTGSVALVADHLNLTGVSPLTGVPSDSPSGSPFVDLSDAWSSRLRALAKEVDPTLVEGVYAQLPGPHFETPAEIRTLASLGADLVGMSIALEAIAARHLGLEVLGLAVASNPAAGLAPEVLSADGVVDVAASAVDPVAEIVRRVIERLGAPDPA